MMTHMDAPDGLIRRASTPLAETGQVHAIGPQDAGWRYVGFSDHRLAAGMALERVAEERERAVVVLEGSATVTAGDQRWSSLGSRERVFDTVAPPVLLLEPGLDLRVEAETEATIIVGEAPAAEVRRTLLFEPGDIQVVSNHSIAHSRTAYVDFEEPEKRRHLLPLLLRKKTSWSESTASGRFLPSGSMPPASTALLNWQPHPRIGCGRSSTRKSGKRSSRSAG